MIDHDFINSRIEFYKSEKIRLKQEEIKELCDSLPINQQEGKKEKKTKI